MSYSAEEYNRVAVKRQLVERMAVTSMTYFIVKWAVGSLLHCALPLLIPDFNDYDRIDVLPHQLAGLGDGYGNLQHKAGQTHSGPGRSFTQAVGEAG